MSIRTTGSSSAGSASAGMGAASYSVIDQHSSVSGTLTTSRDLRIEGVVQGEINCEGTLEIAEGSEVDATVVASSIIVAGTISGTITCRGRLEIRSTGVVQAQVDTDRLVIREGGVFEGQLRMSPSVAAPRSAAPEPDEAEEPTDSPASSTTPGGSGYSFLRSFSTNPPVSDAQGHDVPGPRDEDDEPR